MSKRTKKVGVTGWMGPRYGIRIRRRVQEIDKTKMALSACPKCSSMTVQRVGSGVWKCNRCEVTFASDAYAFKPAPSIFRTEDEEPEAAAETPAKATAPAKGTAPGKR